MPIPASDKIVGQSGHVDDHNAITAALSDAPVKPEATDGVVYLSASGSDSSDGLSWGTAKLTVQAAIDALPASGGTVYIGAGTFTVDAPLTLRDDLNLIGAGRRITSLRSTAVDLIDVTADVLHTNLRSLRLESTASHVIDVSTDVTLSRCSFTDLTMVVYGLGKSAINMPDGGLVDCLFEHCEITHDVGATVPTFNLSTTSGNINANTFRRIRFNYSGEYAVRVESATAGTYCSDNTFADINFEITNGGAIDLVSCAFTMLSNISVYDLSASTTNDLFAMRKDAGPACRNNTFTNVGRKGGTLGGGLSDIYAETGTLSTVLINCGAAGGSTFTVGGGGTGCLINSGVPSGSTSMSVLNTGHVYTYRNTTGNRPSAATLGEGAQVFDTTLNIPIWSDGSVWLDAAGNSV